MTTLLIVLAAAAVLVGLVARYGADTRSDGDPTGRDPGWNAAATRDHTPASDLALVRAWTRRVTGYRRCWSLFETSLRPWEPHPGTAAERAVPATG